VPPWLHGSHSSCRAWNAAHRVGMAAWSEQLLHCCCCCCCCCCCQVAESPAGRALPEQLKSKSRSNRFQHGSRGPQQPGRCLSGAQQQGIASGAPQPSLARGRGIQSPKAHLKVPFTPQTHLPVGPGRRLLLQMARVPPEGTPSALMLLLNTNLSPGSPLWRCYWCPVPSRQQQPRLHTGRTGA
jgi:hypothetical protein